MKEVPVAIGVPPLEAVYHAMVPDEAVAPSVKEPVPQLLAGVVAVMDGMVFTFAKTAERAEVQVPSEVST